MPIGAAIAIGTALASSAFAANQSKKNRKSQEEQNEKDRAFQREMYGQQREDSRTDWNNQNTYNSPSQQMERLRQAGLNPHLVYGNGADTTASSVKSYSADTPNQTAPKREFNDLGTKVLQGLDLKFKQAQTDNVNTDTALKVKENLEKDANIASTLQNTARSVFDLEQAQRLKDAVVTKAELDNNKLSSEITHIDSQTSHEYAGTAYQISENQRQQIRLTNDLQKTAQEIISSKIQNAKTQQETENLKMLLQKLSSETTIEQVNAELAKKGVQKGDAPYWREFIKLLNKPLTDISNTVDTTSTLGKLKYYGPNKQTRKN